MNLENRLKKLEKQTGDAPRRRDVKVLTDDELAVIATGNPDAKASDLTDADLRAIIDKYEVEHPDSDILRVTSERAKELTKRILSGEGTE